MAAIVADVTAYAAGGTVRPTELERLCDLASANYTPHVDSFKFVIRVTRLYRDHLASPADDDDQVVLLALANAIEEMVLSHDERATTNFDLAALAVEGDMASRAILTEIMTTRIELRIPLPPGLDRPHVPAIADRAWDGLRRMTPPTLPGFLRLLDEEVARERDRNAPLTARVVQLDGPTRAASAADLEGLLRQAELVLDDPNVEPERELLLAANRDTLIGQLRSPDPDPVIVERAVARLVRELAPDEPALDTFEAGLQAAGLPADTSMSISADLAAIEERLGQIGAEDEATDVIAANELADRLRDAEARFPAVQVSTPGAKPLTFAQKLGAYRKAATVAAAGAVGSVGVKTIFEHYEAIVRAAEAVLRFFT